MDLDGRHQFGSIVVGQANRLAVAAASAVAENPGSTYNPLYIWSAPGLGKTQLLTAIGLRAPALQPELTVVALTADEFVRQLQSAVSAGDAASFHRRFQDTDLLLIDDVQFLAGHHGAQAELLCLCEEFHASGRQIACAGDRPPGDIAAIDARLAAQLSGGLVVEIGLNGPAARASGTVSLPAAAEFLNFISDVATVVAQHVEPWRSSIGEAAERWGAEGYDTAVLQRAMRAGSDPGSDALIATYERCVARLRTLQCDAAAIDADLAAMDIFFDPARVVEAETMVAVAREPVDASVVARRTSRGMVITSIVADDPFFLDDEKVVWDWPDALGRVIEEFR